MGETGTYDPFEAMTFTYDRCFLCGKDVSATHSQEHVFPKWLQHKYNLWDKPITLLNKTPIAYRNLKIPCCSPCNTDLLSQLETEICLYHDKGYPELASADKLRLFQWTGKIFYGLLFKELSLDIDRAEPSSGKIITPDILEEFRTLHLFLQSLRVPYKFVNFRPASVFVFKVRPLNDNDGFDYHDFPLAMTFSIRIGEIGIISVMCDNGLHEQAFSEYFRKFDDVALIPLQFDELVAMVLYKASLLDRVPKYISLYPDDGERVQTAWVPGYSTKPWFKPWDNRAYAKVLEILLGKYGYTFDVLFREPDMFMSFIQNEDGTVKQVGPDDLPSA